MLTVSLCNGCDCVHGSNRWQGPLWLLLMMAPLWLIRWHAVPWPMLRSTLFMASSELIMTSSKRHQEDISPTLHPYNTIRRVPTTASTGTSCCGCCGCACCWTCVCLLAGEARTACRSAGRAARPRSTFGLKQFVRMYSYRRYLALGPPCCPRT